MAQVITPAWGINTVIIGSITVVTVKLRMLRYFASSRILQQLHELGARMSYYTKNGKDYVTIKYSEISSRNSDVVLAIVHKLRYESALAQVHDKYNTNPPGGGGAVTADYGDDSFFDPAEAEL